MTTSQRTRLSTRRRGSIALLLTAVLALGACGGDAAENDAGTKSSDTKSSDKESGSTVAMKLIAFTPGSLEVDAGTKVTWSQDDAGFHTVTSGSVQQGGSGVTPEPDSKFDSGRIAEGDDFEFTFDEPGSYPYFCAIHPATMRGEIRVR